MKRKDGERMYIEFNPKKPQFHLRNSSTGIILSVIPGGDTSDYTSTACLEIALIDVNTAEIIKRSDGSQEDVWKVTVEEFIEIAHQHRHGQIIDGVDIEKWLFKDERKTKV